ncbi:MAG: hypothetical protein U9P90_02885 [Patescibacteria group bacterium]|nr:hypothetical protein [Patescibacteria group bacterium]
MFQKVISIALELEGCDEEKLSRLFDTARPTIRRWSQGVSIPHHGMRRFTFNKIAEMLK